MNFDQTIVNWAFGLVGTLGGFVVKAMWDAIAQLRSDLADLNRAIARDYVRRDDYRDDISEIKGMLARIFDKLDEKADKP
jgi:hypothetical protein